MAWVDGIFKRFLRYWIKAENVSEEKPSFWEEEIQKIETAGRQQQELKNSKETKHIFYIEQEKKNDNEKRKGKDVPIFQKVVFPTKETKQVKEQSLLLQKEIPVLQREKETWRQKFADKEKQQNSIPIFSTKKEIFFSLFDREEKEKIRKKQKVFQESKKRIPEKEIFSQEKKEHTLFLTELEKDVSRRKQIGKSPIVQEMEREYRTEELLQQIVQSTGQHIQEEKNPPISVQIGQVQDRVDIDTIIAEITRKLWEARSIGRCSVERK